MFKKLVKSLLLSGLGLIGVVAVVWSAVKVAADRQTAKMDAIATDYLQQFSVHEDNESARQLDRLNAALGIGGVGRPPADRSHPEVPVDPQKAETMEVIQKQLRDYFENQEQKVSGSLAPLPTEVMEFLKRYQTELEAVKQHLATAEAAAWKLDPEAVADFTKALPSFLNFTNLNRLLLAEAIAHSQAQKPEEMIRSLETAQQLHMPLHQQPYLISYLVSVIMLKDHAAVLRHLDGVPVALADALLAMEHQAIGLQALKFEAWMFYGHSQKLATGTVAYPEILEEKKPNLLYRDYLRLTAADTTQAMQASYQKRPEFEICSPPNVVDLGDEAIAWWNIPGGNTYSAFSNQLLKGERRILELELTQKVLQAKAQKQDDQWPEQLSNLESQVCPGKAWIYEITPEGSMSLRFSHDFKTTEKERMRKGLPLSYQG